MLVTRKGLHRGSKELLQISKGKRAVVTHVAKGVFINLRKSLQQLWPLGLTVRHQEGNESLTVRPPQLHTPLQLLKYTNRIRIFRRHPPSVVTLCVQMTGIPVWGSNCPHPGSRRDHRGLYPSRTDKVAPETWQWPSSGAPRPLALR